MHDFGDFLGFGNGGQNLFCHVINVLVSDDIQSALHSGSGSSLDLLLGIPHARSHFRNYFGQSIAKLLGGSVLEDGNALEGTLTDGPLDLHGQSLEDGRQ